MTCEWCGHENSTVQRYLAYRKDGRIINPWGDLEPDNTKWDPFADWIRGRRVCLCETCRQRLEPSRKPKECSRCHRYRATGEIQPSGRCAQCESVVIRETLKLAKQKAA